MPASSDANQKTLLASLQARFKACKTADELYQQIADAPFEHKLAMAHLFLGFISFFLVDESKSHVYLAAVSDNEYYRDSVRGHNFNPKKYILKLDDPKNNIAQAIYTNQITSTEDWGTLSQRSTSEEAARLNQANAGIGCTRIYPLQGNTRGALMYNYFQYQDVIGKPQQDFMEAYTHLVADSLKV